MGRVREHQVILVEDLCRFVVYLMVGGKYRECRIWHRNIVPVDAAKIRKLVGDRDGLLSGRICDTGERQEHAVDDVADLWRKLQETESTFSLVSVKRQYLQEEVSESDMAVMSYVFLLAFLAISRRKVVSRKPPTMSPRPLW